ncbi:hypothetical protein [Oceanobacillus saliphilus]|uniref:hypothetical protein n=1 Tax=Oceanobacillus saliphilus TaxID=2925834 RepID=UPI00201E252F|nr:hypothetical protein [Oceanobacillus saliphilus]
MKNRLYIISNQKGFTLLYVLYITVIVFLLITASIQNYQRDLEITDRHIQQLHVETLFQMGREKVKSEITHLNFPVTRTYDFSDGQVAVEVKQLNVDTFELLFTITLSSDDYIFGIRNLLKYEEIVTE